MLRSVHALPTPIGNYVRPTRRDQRLMLNLLGEDRLPLSGLVIDPVLWDVHEELSREAANQGMEIILDSQALELSTPAGFDRTGLSNLPWAGQRPHEPSDLQGDGGRVLVQGILDFAEGKPFSGYLSPAHFLGGTDSEWLDVDIEMAHRMRRELDDRGAHDKLLYFPLIVHTEVLRSAGFRRRIVERLRNVHIDGLWVKAHPFGTTNSGPLALRRYIEACRDFHALDIPLIGDRTGTVGVALAAFGAVGGIEAGLTLGERFDVVTLMRPRNGKAFAPPPRVYLREIGAFVSRKQAQQFFGQRGMKPAFGCQQDGCCRRGVIDMIADPRRHFVLSRGRELEYLSSMPEPLRAGRYLEQHLRPATDLAVRATRALPSLERHRRRLDGWREALGSLHQSDEVSAITYSGAPDGSRKVRHIDA